MDREGGIVDCRHASRELGPTRVLTIFVPPAKCSPVLADIGQEIGCGDLLGSKAAHIVSRIVQHDFAIVSPQFPINTQANWATGEIEYFSNVIGVCSRNAHPSRPVLAFLLPSSCTCPLSPFSRSFAA